MKNRTRDICECCGKVIIGGRCELYMTHNHNLMFCSLTCVETGQKDLTKRKETCNHVIGQIFHYVICSGRDSMFIYKSDSHLKEDEDFMAFKYCPNCGKRNE